MRHGKYGRKMINVSKTFWKSKRVLITGHTGFKGTWLTLWLQDLGATIRGISLDVSENLSMFNETAASTGIDHCIADIRDLSQIQLLVSEFKPEIIIHMAAQALVRHSYSEPVETYSTNIMGSVHVIEAARKAKSVKAFLMVTTDKCYENREWLWGYRENERMGGWDPYSSSKACVELMSSAYRNSFLKNEGIALATARAGNVIGGGDWAADRIVPDVIRALEKKLPINIRNPEAIRPWQHVLEPLSGYLILTERLFEIGNKYADGWNFGPKDDDVKSVKWIVENMCNKWDPGSKWTIDNTAQQHEARLLKLDISKARQGLGWSPRWSLSTAPDKIIEWHRGYESKYDMRQLTLKQIFEYEDTKC